MSGLESSVQPLTVGEVGTAAPTAFSLVCEELGVSPLQVLCPDRHPPLPMARQLIAWLLHDWQGWNVTRIAAVLGVDWGTVAYYLRNVKRRQKNGEWTAVCHRLVQKLIAEQ